jgi:predicted PhzF superfamily epimerase YddE/YHI9
MPIFWNPPATESFRCYARNAFVGPGLSGNPAGIVFVQTWPSAARCWQLARRLGYPETAFVRPGEAHREAPSYAIRWFYRGGEVQRCLHATLAAASLLLAQASPPTRIGFHSPSAGRLTAQQDSDLVWLAGRVPHYRLEEAPPTPKVPDAPGASLLVPAAGGVQLRVVPRPEEVAGWQPMPATIRRSGLFGLGITAWSGGGPWDEDYVLRFVAPDKHPPEDAVTGSLHAMVAHYWMRRSRRAQLTGRQLSSRGGLVYSQWGTMDTIALGGACSTDGRR